MADTLVEGTVSTTTDNRGGLWGPYWSDVNTAIIIFLDDGNDLSFARTTDKGASWSTTQIEVGNVVKVAVWYDKETPGDSGTLVHIAWLDEADADGSEDARYVTVDVSDASVGTIRTIDGGLDVPINGSQCKVAITKAANGNLLVAFNTGTEIECYRSIDAGVNWTDRADVFEDVGQQDHLLLFPANVDGGDCCALYWDISANEVSLKMYDDSLNSWTETSISTGMTEDSIHINMDGAVRHSDNHVLMAAHNNDDVSLDDIQTWDLTVDSIASPTVTAKTNVVTNQAESAQVAVFINQQTDDVYVAYLKGGTWTAVVDVVYHRSTTGMASWDDENTYSESAADDFRRVQAGRTVGNDGGRYQPSFYNDDLIDIYVNETNDIEIAAAAAFVQGQAVVTGSGALAAVASLILPASVVFAGVGDMVAAGTIGVIRQGAALMAGAGDMVAVGTMTFAGKAALDGVGTVVAVGKRGVEAAAALDGVGAVTAIGEITTQLEGRAAIAGVGSMTVTAERIVTGQAALAGVGAQAATGVITAVGAATIAGVGTVAAIGQTGVILFTIFGIEREIDPDDFPTARQVFFEVHLAAPSGGIAFARLFNVTDAVEVADSQLSTAEVDKTRLRSVALTLPSGAKIYRTEYGGS